MTMRRVKLLYTALMLLASHGALAVSYPLPPEGSRLVGSAFTIAVPDNNTQPLESFAAQYGQGLSNMLEANPGVDVYLPRSGSTLTIPQQLILPDTVREGIVINVAEMRLYYYPPLGNSVEVLPIGIGQAGRETPRNWVTAVERKQEGPTWVPTANTRREYAKEGKTLPAMVPPGPDNPMGLYAIYIGRLYAIHGTNANFGIGLRVSQGCIRLRNDDIKFEVLCFVSKTANRIRFSVAAETSCVVSLGVLSRQVNVVGVVFQTTGVGFSVVATAFIQTILIAVTFGVRVRETSTDAIIDVIGQRGTEAVTVLFQSATTVVGRRSNRILQER